MKTALRVRPARSHDAHAAAPLILASGEREFAYLLRGSREARLAFLRRAFVRRAGAFSWTRHHVAVDEHGAVLAILAVHDGRRVRFDHLCFFVDTLLAFGPLRTAPILLRGVILQGEIPAPGRHERLVAHCATREDKRGQGIFTALFRSVHATLRRESDRAIWLDVLASNEPARRLYARLGFASQGRVRPRSARLPAELEAVRMRLDRFS
jgi:GNAT superfamily N-acetyltransferase